jgi:hypothetical protein
MLTDLRHAGPFMVIFIRTGVPRSAKFRQWSAVQDVAPGQVGEQESMPARQVGDPSAN